VFTGTAVEFRIQNAAGYRRQGYVEGEVRISLTRLPGETTKFKVEDYLRPLPPEGTSYALPEARESCRAVWTSADGTPLRAELRDGRLTIDVIRMWPDNRMFRIEGDRVVACRHLQRSKVEKIESVLTPQLVHP
jgi:hypothetical protein